MKKKSLTISLIVSTYNRPDALAVCLDSIAHQSRLPDEVIISDDGSRADTAALIEEISKEFPVPLKHVWHEDRGFRLAEIRNKSVAASIGDYIIETDGDIMLHPRFVEDHERMASPNKYLKGTRVLLSKRLTDAICRSGRSIRIPFWHSGIEAKRETGIRSPFMARLMRDNFKKGHAIGLGCNMSFWRKDFEAVNGYDEDFTGWGKEDDDLAHRLHRLGSIKRDLRFYGIVYHLWHPEATRASHSVNEARMREHDDSGLVRVERGLDSHL